MSNDQAFQQISSVSLVVNVKYEPTDESDELGQLKITEVFSINAAEAITESHEGFQKINRFPTKSLKQKLVADFEISKDVAPEGTTTGRRYSLRARNVLTYDENLDQQNCPSPARIREPSAVQMRKASPVRKQKSKTVKSPSILKCDICSIVFFSVESLEEHVIDMHVVDKEFDCSKCTKSFISQDRLESHMTDHANEDQMEYCDKCPVCSKTMSSRSYLKRHLLTHEAVKPFKCKLCSNSYVRDRDLNHHEMNQHGKEKKFKCPKCSKSFARNYVLQDHIRTHSNAKTIVCPNCSASFKTKQSLRNHRVCCKVTRPLMKLSGKDKSTQNTGKVKSKRQIAREYKHNKVNYQYKQHFCKVCNKIFMSAGNLRTHMICHSDERNFICNLCSKTFKRNSQLKSHLKTKHD